MAKILKQREDKVDKAGMSYFADSNIDSDTTDAEIFEMLRSLQDDAAESNAKLINLGEMYWFLKERRNEAQKNAKNS